METPATRGKEFSNYPEHLPLILHMQSVLDLTDQQLYAFSQINPNLRIERNSHGELIIMPPTGGQTSERDAEITMQLRLWSKRDGSGASQWRGLLPRCRLDSIHASSELNRGVTQSVYSLMP